MSVGPVRALIVDNYDSFTHNLVQYLGQLTDTDPQVVRNDDPAWRGESLAEFDCVVISPGPGRPEVPADFGICAAVIKEAVVPLLGVCLGHQGIGHVFGGTVTAAPEPMHGRVSHVRHTGDELFAGIPSPFPAVRYHSLMVGEIPDALAIIAIADDGVPMGLRHRSRPVWGVQFHPESICTADGMRLVSNFVGIAESFRCRRALRPIPAVGGAAPAAPAGPQVRAPLPAGLRVLERRIASGPSAEAVFEALYRYSEHSFWLDSGMRQGDTGRFSFLGDSSGPLARVATADVRRGEVRVESAAGSSTYRGSFFDWIRDDLLAQRCDIPPLPFDFSLGWVGYLGYELKAETGGDDRHRSPYPDASMIFADRAIAFDHDTGEVHLLALAEVSDENQATRWLDLTERLLDAVRRAPWPPASASASLGGMRLRHDRPAYLDLIAACQREIRAGETYEICLTNMIEVPGTLDSWPAYRSLRRDNPVPYGALLRFGGLSVLSFSPERFLRVGRDGVAESKPIKGTRPRGRTPAEDDQLRVELAVSEKDRAENLMIVDLVRNDLGRCAQVGSVRVERIFDVETYSTVHQLASTVRGRLRIGVHAVDCVRAAFPGGSMTGAPKIRTMGLIDDLEAGPRGVYSGAIGYLSLGGAADLSITIRTLVATPDVVHFGVGGAIIALSDPDVEYEETAVKATALLRLLGQEFPGRYPQRRETTRVTDDVRLPGG